MSPKILVIDDHKDTRDLVMLVLKKQGYRVLDASSGKAGLDKANVEEPDLILLDVMMPDMDGFTVCRQIRKHPTLSETPVILLTAKSQADEKWEGFQAGANDYLIKPTNAEELKRRVKVLLDRHAEKHGIPIATPSEPSAEEPSEPGTVITHSPFARGQITAFVGACGGVGTTMVAINTAFAHSLQKATLLVDFDMQQGHIGLYLNQKRNDGLNELAAGSALSIRAQIPNVTQTLTPNLQAILSASNLDNAQPQFDAEDVPALADALQQAGRTVIVDCGVGLTTLNRPILERADQIVICTRPSRIALAGTRSLYAALDDLIMPTASVDVLMVTFDSDIPIPAERVEQYLGQKLLDSLSFPKEKVAKAANSGKPLVAAFPKEGFIQKFSDIAQKVTFA